MLLIDGLDADDAPKQVHPAKAKGLASKKGFEWDSLHLLGRAEIISTAMGEPCHWEQVLRPTPRFWIRKGVSSGSRWIFRNEKRWCQRAWASSICLLLPSRVPGKGTRLGFVESIGTRRVDQRGPLCHGERRRMGHIKKQTEATKACARKFARSAGRDWDSMWTLTQESYRDEAGTICQKC